ncbi:MAG: ribulose-phosphate 3-epimerase [Candidatus Sumerlaeaceae bacterium]|nr:ribulose-phosphate 3-epimerase [Candidatus Sumerlaeaceae bacterium]
MKSTKLGSNVSSWELPLIAPSLLSADFAALGTEVRRALREGCRWLHLDVMDNHFVPNLTFGPPVIRCLRKAAPKAFFDAHLMVDNPETLVKPCADAGVELLTFHYEACSERSQSLIELIRNHGMQVGISVRPATPVGRIESYLRHVDLVLVMTVEPGFGGQAMIPSCLNKIRTLKRLREKQHARFLIQVDGGINETTIGLAVAAGAEVLVAGSAVFSNGEISANLAKLRGEIRKTLRGTSF